MFFRRYHNLLTGLARDIDQVLANQQALLKGIEKLMAMSDAEREAVKALSDGLTKLNTDIDAAVASLEAGNDAEALAAFQGLQAQVDALDAKSTALVKPTPTA